MLHAVLVDPPVDSLAPHGPEWAFMIANLVAAALAFSASAAWSIRERAALPLWCAAGGFLSMLANEPVLDRLMLVWYPTNTPWILLHLYDIAMPLYLFIGYPWYVGLGAFVVHRMIGAGASAKKLWTTFAVVAVLDVVIELPSTAAGVHVYYGQQPNFFHHGLAITIPFVMSAIVVVCGVVLHRAVEARQASPLAVVALIPGVAVGALVATQWPVMLAQNSTASGTVVWLCAGISIVLTMTAVQAAIRNRRAA